ncbi:MAG: hypothetical protein Q9166_007262 [cf. Caloplaca sp. 2 TL-2023]
MQAPHLTPEQMQVATTYLSPEEALMMAASLTPQMLQSQLDNIHDDRGAEIIASVVIVAFLATAAVALRLLCRRQMKVAISYDDYLIIAGLVRPESMAQVASELLICQRSLHSANAFVKPTIQYAFQHLWSVGITCIKLSILLFYRRLFPQQTTSAKWRICHLLLCTASVALGVISIFGSTFQCTPVAFLWDPTIPDGHCINFSAFARFTSVFHIVTDILILAMPMPIVWSLHLDKSKKIGVCGLFLLGGFVCITSIIRFYYLEALGHGSDPSWDNVNAAIWSTVEPCIGIVCACLPIMGPLLRTHIVSFSTSAFRSRSKKSRQASSGYTGDSSRSRKGFGSLGGKVGSKGGQDEEMGIPLKDKTEVGVKEISRGS